MEYGDRGRRRLGRLLQPEIRHALPPPAMPSSTHQEGAALLMTWVEAEEAVSDTRLCVVLRCLEGGGVSLKSYQRSLAVTHVRSA